jgi:hypothetical protein
VIAWSASPGTGGVVAIAHRRAARAYCHRAAVGQDAVEALVDALDRQTAEDVEVPQLRELGPRRSGRHQIQLGECLLVGPCFDQQDLDVVGGPRTVRERGGERHARVAASGDHHALPRSSGGAGPRIDDLHVFGSPSFGPAGVLTFMPHMAAGGTRDCNALSHFGPPAAVAAGLPAEAVGGLR